jgi:tRNA1(Val) A37 N6-methylase TrmN6
VLDPFGGAGTVALVANRLQRDAVLIEIKPEYIEMAQRRISDDAPLLADVQILKGGETDEKEEARQETQAESSTRAGVLSTEGAPAGALS